MKVKVLAVLIALALCVSLAGVIAPPHPSTAIAKLVPVVHTWHVATTGNDIPGYGNETYPWQTIQYAIDHANANDTIMVHPGQYAATNLVGKSNLTIQSSNGPGQTTVHGSIIIGFNVTAPDVTIDGFNITACSVGIILENGADNCTIKNNIVVNNAEGIDVFSSNNTINGNTIQRTYGIYGGGSGIHVGMDSHNNLIINNNITDNGHGIWIESSNNKVLGNNILNNNLTMDSGVHVTGDLEDVYIEFNNIMNNSGSESYGVFSNSTFPVWAYDNWWGNTTGPHDPEFNENGTGDAVNGTIYYEPWLGAPLVLPIHYEELVGAGPHVVDATAEANTTVNLMIAEETDSLDIVIARYASQPFPEAAFPNLSLGKFIDIGFPGGSYPEYDIVWPIHVAMTYTDEELNPPGIDETTLGFYYMEFQYYDDSFTESWGRHWVHTGVDTANKTIWANLVPSDFGGGSPFGTGGLSGPRNLADNIYVSDSSGNDTWDGQSPTWNGTSGSGPKKTIQGGIDAVAVGGTVHVENGTYSVSGTYAAYIDNPDLTIYSSDGPGAAIVSGPGDNFGFWVDDSGVTIDGFNVTGFDHGIYLSDDGWGADNCTIKNCNANGNEIAGIYLDTSNCHIFSSNVTNNTYDGIYVDSDAEGTTIEDCNATSNGGSGIVLFSSNCSIFSSNLTNNGFSGIYLYDASDNTIEDCNATGNGLSSDGGGIWLTIASYDNTIDNCNANNNTYGIHIDNSGDNTIDGCDVYNNTYGIHLDSSDNNSIANSTVSQNTVHGILLDSADDNQIRGNNILDNPGSSNPPPKSGIHLTGGSHDNIIRFNNIVGNSPAGSDSYGIYNDYVDDYVTADNNWWGSDTGPTHSDNPGGTGDAVSDYVDYSPWLGAPLVLPAVHYESLSAGTYTVNASAEADTNVTLTISDGEQTDIYIARYASPPFPGASFPDTALGIYIDILVSNPDAVNWPIQVNVTYADDDVTTAGIDETTLGLYYYNATANAFVRCSNTGVDTANNIIWANVNQEEAGYLVGTPFAAGGQPSAPPPSPVSAVPTLSQWGMIAMAVLFVGALAGTVRRRLAAARVRCK